MACDDRNVVVESVKRAEDSDSIIVRVYEAHNARGTAEMSIAKPIKAAYLCDMLENDLGELDIADGCVRFDYRPFEILTIKLAV